MEMEITVHSTNQQACVPVSVKETRAACSVISVVCSIISFHGNQAVVHLGQMTQLQSVKPVTATITLTPACSIKP